MDNQNWVNRCFGGSLYVYLKMRWERGLCLGNLNEDRAEYGVGFVDLNAATTDRLTPERRTDLAADIESFRFSLDLGFRVFSGFRDFVWVKENLLSCWLFVLELLEVVVLITWHVQHLFFDVSVHVTWLSRIYLFFFKENFNQKNKSFVYILGLICSNINMESNF